MRCAARHACVLLLALATACGSSEPTDDGGNPPPAGNTIAVRNNSFSPAALSIGVGDSVRFQWDASSTNHDVVPASGNAAPLPSSPGAPLLLDAPQDFWVAFPAAGEFRFGCSAHSNVLASAGTLSGMVGAITVE